MNYKEVIEEVFQKVNIIEEKGELASYIPELANVESRNFGVHISTITNFNFGIGNFQEKFSIQSIAKVFSLCLAYKMLGGSIWNRLGVEPSGTGFNSLIQKVIKKPILLSLYKMPELTQRFWTCSSKKIEQDLSFKPKVSLQEGVAQTSQWYQDNGWL